MNDQWGGHTELEGNAERQVDIDSLPLHTVDRVYVTQHWEAMPGLGTK